MTLSGIANRCLKVVFVALLATYCCQTQSGQTGCPFNINEPGWNNISTGDCSEDFITCPLKNYTFESLGQKAFASCVLRNSNTFLRVSYCFMDDEDQECLNLTRNTCANASEINMYFDWDVGTSIINLYINNATEINNNTNVTCQAYEGPPFMKLSHQGVLIQVHIEAVPELNATTSPPITLTSSPSIPTSRSTTVPTPTPGSFSTTTSSSPTICSPPLDNGKIGGIAEVGVLVALVIAGGIIIVTACVIVKRKNRKSKNVKNEDESTKPPATASENGSVCETTT